MRNELSLWSCSLILPEPAGPSAETPADFRFLAGKGTSWFWFNGAKVIFRTPPTPSTVSSSAWQREGWKDLESKPDSAPGIQVVMGWFFSLHDSQSPHLKSGHDILTTGLS